MLSVLFVCSLLTVRALCVRYSLKGYSWTAESNPDPDAGLKPGWAGLTKNNNRTTTTTKNPSSQVENADCVEKGIGEEGWVQPSAGPGAWRTFLQRQ